MEPARRVVELWRDRLATVARNIADLGETDDVRRLRSRLSSGEPYEGTTLVAARRVAAALDGLWADYLLLSRIVDEAAEMSRRTLLRPARENEAMALLDGRSIRLPAISVPVRARGLLDAAERHDAATPQEVLDAMVAGFDVARRGVSAITAAETAGRIKLAALRAGSGVRDPATLARLDAAARTIDRDPLAAADILASLGTALATARAEAETAADRHAVLGAALAQARADLEALNGTIAGRDAARREAEGLVTLPDLGADPTLGPDGLGVWLDRLALAGQGKAVSLGLQRWSAALGTARAAALLETETVTRRVAERDDLRGRFRALAVKAETLVARGFVLPVSLADVGTEIDRRPFAPERAGPLLARFEAALAVAAGTAASRGRAP